MPTSSYKNGAGYQAYFNAGTRPENLPPYDQKEDAVVVYQGEVYCRYREDGILCHVDTPFSSTAGLRHHLKRHGLSFEAGKTGAPSLSEQMEVARWYAQFRPHAGNEAESRVPSRASTSATPASVDLARSVKTESHADPALVIKIED